MLGAEMNSNDTLNYIADMTRELEAMAAEAGHEKVAYLLRMVQSECKSDDPSALPPVQKDSSDLPN
jgi:hypothetical protein